MPRGANIFIFERDTDLHNYDRSHRCPILGFVCYKESFEDCGFQLLSVPDV